MDLFSRLLRPNRAAALTILMIAGYTVLVGASASVVRAALMGSLAVAAQRIGRNTGSLHAVAFASLAMTALNPMTLWDVGFQLSVSATLGLVLYGDRFQGAFERWLSRWLPAERAKQGAELAGELFLITLAAQVTTLPILLYYFRQLSLITLAANLVVLPVQPAVMILGGLALLAGLVWLPLGGASALALGVTLVWGTAFSLPETPGQLRVTLLDTDPDPAVLIQTPAGGAALINSGSSGGAITRGLARYLPLFQSQLDMLVLAGADDLAVGGLPDVLARYHVARVIETSAPAKGRSYPAVMTALAGQGAAAVNARGRPAFDLGDGITLRVLADTAHGSSLWLDWRAFSLALPLGVVKPVEAEKLLRASPTAAAVMVLAEADQAAAAALATAPAEPQTERPSFASRTVLRMGERGALTITTDGRQVWVEAER